MIEAGCITGCDMWLRPCDARPACGSCNVTYRCPHLSTSLNYPLCSQYGGGEWYEIAGIGQLLFALNCCRSSLRRQVTSPAYLSVHLPEACMSCCPRPTWVLLLPGLWGKRCALFPVRATSSPIDVHQKSDPSLSYSSFPRCKLQTQESDLRLFTDLTEWSTSAREPSAPRIPAHRTDRWRSFPGALRASLRGSLSNRGSMVEV